MRDSALLRCPTAWDGGTRMSVYYERPGLTLHQGHVLDVLTEMDAESIDVCVTSPPYLGLRAYSGEQERVWRNEAEPCAEGEHEWGELQPPHHPGQVEQTKWANAEAAGKGQTAPSGRFCRRCGAWRGGLGLEPSVALYVQHIVEVCRAIRRVLKPTAVFWLNLGDSYAGSNNGSNDYRSEGVSLSKSDAKYQGQRPGRMDGVKPLDLMGVPEQVVLALRADGWYWRSTVIYNKPAPMPESVGGWEWRRCRVKTKPREKGQQPSAIAAQAVYGNSWPDNKGGVLQGLAQWADCPGCPKCEPNGGYVLRRGSGRPTRSHEVIYVLAKTADYYWDTEAVREPHDDKHGLERFKGKWGINNEDWEKKGGEQVKSWAITHRNYNPNGRNIRDVWTLSPEPFSGVADYGNCRIASADCPIHGYQAAHSPVQSDDVLPDVSRIDHSHDNGGHPAQWREGVVVSIPLDLSSLPSDEFAAILRNSESRRTEDESGPNVIFYDIPSGHTAYTELVLRSSSKFVRKYGSKTLQDAWLDEPDWCPSGQTLYHIAGTVTKGPPPTGCLCHYIGKVLIRQDHFAVYPTELPLRCILASTSERGNCPKCGSPWARIVERVSTGHSYAVGKSAAKRDVGLATSFSGYDDGSSCPEFKTLGWRATCTHTDLDPVPAVCLDPFFGSGRTGLAAQKAGRRCVGIELSEDYCALAARQLQQGGLV